ncbi:MAG TPA: uridine diphosphate-N-acetylglucosamine-binding protein YvcK [Thermoanaerobaculia bacterium]|nr:uridine diphosphate-N-acetylglucosamine-binding protein YvcK [Thermoanaerobaculia bacterium]
MTLETNVSTMGGPPGRGGALVAIGGGTGLSVLLRGLKHHVGSSRLGCLTGVVTVTDDGGSSGRLRREFGVLPPGDIRNCIVALADDEDLLARLFQYRFPNGGGLVGHSFGNLFLTALTGITGDFHQAILTAESVLSVRGKIYPATLVDVHLRGRGVSGRTYEGESAVGTSGEELAGIELDPAAAPAFPPAVAALESAGAILLGPGSLYTSIIPNLLIPGIRQAVAKSRARVILLLNLMTQPGETDGMMGAAHLQAVERHIGTGLVHTVLYNATPIPAPLLAHYAETGSEPVAVEPAAMARPGVELVGADLLAEGDLIRHDPEKLSRAVLDLLEPLRRRPAAAGG